MDVFIGGRRVPLDPATMVGKGGEAEVFPYGPDQVLKVFKGPDHPDLCGFKAEQQAARERLEEQQRKLPAFPSGLPSSVVAPAQLATDKRGRRILGYVMRRVGQAEPLLRLSDPVFRRTFSSSEVVEVFRNLHSAVQGLHQQGVVIGDFNDLNVLIQGRSVHLIDADSFQYGPFLSRVFTDRFLDPLLMAPNEPVLHRPYQPSADWFAFTALLMQSLLLVGPWGGVHRPAAAASRVPATQRALRRLSVWSPEVQYPRPARPLASLPDGLLELFRRTFEEDHRAPVPRALLDGLRFSRCASCGLEHARPQCPSCPPHASALSRTSVTVRGKVVARTLYSTEGVILIATLRGGALRCVSRQGTDLVTQDGALLLRGPPPAGLGLVRSSRGWWAMHQGAARVLPGATGEAPDLAELPGQRGPPTTLQAEVLAANDQHLFWAAGGGLFRDGPLGAERLGSVLEGQTRFAVGPRFGAGFYRAGNFATLFTFDTQRSGLREDSSALRLTGSLLQVRFALSDTHAWLLISTADHGQVRHSILVVDAAGAVLGRTVPADVPEWLEALKADPAAVGPLLFVPSDRGVLRVELRGGIPTVTREFADTEPFVDSGTPLLFDGRGLIAVRTQQVLQLQMQ